MAHGDEESSVSSKPARRGCARCYLLTGAPAITPRTPRRRRCGADLCALVTGAPRRSLSYARRVLGHHVTDGAGRLSE